MDDRRRLVMINSEARVASLVRQANLDATILTANDLEQWSEHLSSHFGAIGVLEIDFNSPTLSEQISIVREFRSQSGQSRERCESVIFAVGSFGLRQFVPELLIFGFAGVFCSQADGQRLRKSATNYWSGLQWPLQPLEERVRASLPWQNLV